LNGIKIIYTDKMNEWVLIHSCAIRGNSTDQPDFTTAKGARAAMKDYVIWEGEYITVISNPFPYWPQPHSVIYANGARSEWPTIASYSDLHQHVKDELWNAVAHIFSLRPDFVLSINYAITPMAGRPQSVPVVHVHLLNDPLKTSSSQWFQIDALDFLDPDKKDLVKFFGWLNEMNARLFDLFLGIAGQEFRFSQLSLLSDHGDGILEFTLEGDRTHPSTIALFERVYAEAEHYLLWVGSNPNHPFWGAFSRSQLSKMRKNGPESALLTPRDVLWFSLGICRNSVWKDVLRLKFTVNDVETNPTTWIEWTQRWGGFLLAWWFVNRWPEVPSPSESECIMRDRFIGRFANQVIACLSSEGTI
jgi:diadenosine tetraphosphate (Ap4A) HIT family hydrolase